MVTEILAQTFPLFASTCEATTLLGITPLHLGLTAQRVSYCGGIIKFQNRKKKY